MKFFISTKNHRASVLLLSFFIVSFLILVAMGVSLMVYQDIKALRALQSGIQSQYASEAMMEYGLLEIVLHLPGYENSFEDYPFTSNVASMLSIHAREEMIPCSPIAESSPWKVLAPGDTFQMPLFSELPSGDLELMKEFYVEFYIGDESGDGHYVSGNVLRWRILGETNSGTSEAISAYIPLTSGSSVGPETATQFGTNVAAGFSDYTSASYYSTESYTYYPSLSILAFLNMHNKNVLFLTNLNEVSSSYSYIYFRIHSTDPLVLLSCDVMSLEAASASDFGNTYHEGELFVEEGTNQPVFDFSVYHTQGPEFTSPGSGILDPIELDILSPF